MIQCQNCGWMLTPGTKSKPCPACGSKVQLILSTDMAVAAEASPPVLFTSHEFAPEWFEDALSEARRPSSSGSPENRNSKRREIIFAVCCVEAYLLEWTYHQVIGRNMNQLSTYFPPGKKIGISGRLTKVTKHLYDDGLLPNQPDFGGMNKWRTLINFRDGLIHANASRPQSNLPADPIPQPSLGDLNNMPKGWAVNVISDVIRRLHTAAGTPPPTWLVAV